MSAAVTVRDLPGGWQVGPAMSGREDRVWIRCPDGEGGDFDRAEYNFVLLSATMTGELPRMLERFFWENF